MTRKEYAESATKFLCNILSEDINAVAKIINAQAEVLEGDEKGYGTLIDALQAVLEFVDELIENLEEKE